MTNIIIYDFEVFKNNTLLGAIVLCNNEEKLVQLWDLNEIINFYNNYSTDIWIGWNSSEYDTYIMQAIIMKQDPYLISKKLIKDKSYYPQKYIKLLDFDLMKTFKSKTSLKLTELIRGSSIETTEVSFDLDRPLTDEEKLLTEKYNYEDLKQTLYNFNAFYYKFELQLDIIKEFNLNIYKYLNSTGTQIGAGALGAKKDYSLKYKPVKPIIYDNLKLNNKRLLDYYFNEEFRESSTKSNDNEIIIGNAVLKLGKGGLHYAQKKVHYNKLLYIDISGAYNTVMIKYDLFSRAIPETGKELYKYMFEQENKLKKTNPKKRKVYKTVLLSVYGGQMNEYTDFADPWKGLLVPITLQLFIVDLLEKIEDKCTFVQVNTDGISLIPKEGFTEEQIINIINSWENRTGFKLKFEHIYNVWQRDVNNYFYQTEDGELTYLGEALKNYDISDKSYSSGSIFESPHPPIVAKGIIDYLIYGIYPEETVEKFKNELRYFQFPCKKVSFDYLTYDITYLESGATTSIEIGSICRAFAWNSKEAIGKVNKHKANKTALVANLPDSVFIYNKEILSKEAVDKLSKKIDYSYYINRIYERILEFVDIN